MSSFLLSKPHIDALVTAALRWADRGKFRYYAAFRQPRVSGMRALTRDNADEVGAMLWRENYLQAEFDGEDPRLAAVPPYVFEELPGDPDPIVILRAISCYGYQTAGDDPKYWMSTEAYGFTIWLESAAIRRLPGIERAPWGIEDRDVFVTWAAQQSREPGPDGLATA